MIDNATKEQITSHLSKYCDNAGSANKASAQLGISGATISKMLSGKHNDIADDMWRKMSKVLGFKLEEQWQHADTVPHKAFNDLFTDAQLHSSVYGVVCQPGSGKTYTLDRYRRSNPNVWYVKCKRHTSEGELMQDLLRSMGKNPPVRAINGLLAAVLQVVERSESPVIIFDEIEKVKNDTLFLVIDLYNILQYKCGIVLIGTPNLKARIERGVRLNKMCFNELHSRLGGRFIEVPSPTQKDGAAIMRANGIDDQMEINTILNDSHAMDSTGIDLRRVERLVHKEKIIKEVA